MSLLFVLIEDANEGKEEVEDERVAGGEMGEDGEEETIRDVDPRLSLQFSELLPLHAFPVWAAQD